MSRTLQNIFERAVEGSGKWFISSDAFYNWTTGNKRLLWGWGIPGAGKTTLVAIITNHLRLQRVLCNKELNGVAVLFLKHNDEEQTLENLLACLLNQLLVFQPDIPACLLEFFEKHAGANHSATSEELFEALSSYAQSSELLHIMVDGLDECPEEVRWPLVDKLLELPDNTCLFLTSRFLDNMDDEFSQFEQLEIRANREDIELFVDSQIKNNENLRKMVRKHHAMRSEIKEKVIDSAQGIFLLARLHVDSLVGAALLSVKYVRRKLESLPTTLKDTYDDAMSRIQSQPFDHKTIAIKSLAWVTYASRPLFLRELQHAINIEPNSIDLDEEALVEGHSIISLCAGLLVIDQGKNEVNLVHYTAKKYFEDVRTVSFPGFYATITLSCATYLNLDVLKNAHVRDITQWYPLACYAVQHMAEHARQHPETLDPFTLEAICQLFSHPDKRRPLLALLDGLDLINAGFYSSKDASIRFTGYHENETIEVGNLALSVLRSDTICSDSQIDDGDRETTSIHTDIQERQIRASQGPEATALHLAASVGLAKVASMLLKGPPNVYAVDLNGNIALNVAMNRGFQKAVEFLIEKNGACVDLEQEHGRAILLFAAERNWDRIGDIIIRKYDSYSTEQDSQYFQEMIDFVVSVYRGDAKHIRTLSAIGQLDLRDKDQSLGCYLLFLSVERRHSELVPVLVSLGVDINAHDDAGQTSLHRATRNKDGVMMRALLQQGLEIDHKDDAGFSAFSANLSTRDEHILNILLEAGANPNIKGHNGSSDMYLAGCAGNVDEVRFLLRLGIDPSITTDFGWAPLHWASNAGHIETVKVLLEAGANTSPVSDQDSTPLDLAIQSKQHEIVEILRTAGARQRKDVYPGTVPIPQVQGLRMTPKSDGWVDIINKESKSTIGSTRNHTVFVFDEPLYQNLHHGQFIYQPKDNFTDDSNPTVFNIRQPIDKPSTTVVVGCLKDRRRPDMIDYYSEHGLDDYFENTETVYRIVSKAPNYQSLELQPGNNSQVGHVITMKRIWASSWHIHRQIEGSSEPLFRTMSDWSAVDQEATRWATPSGAILARSSREIETPTIILEPGISDEMRAILISSWIAKIWYLHQTDKTNNRDGSSMK